MDVYTVARFLILFHVCLVTGASRCDVSTRIESGWVCGARRVADDGSHYASFRGIPYAAQPLGRLRFKELQPVTPWSHHLDATEEGPACPQHDEVYGRLIKPIRGMSEACIYANVHVPIKDKTNKTTTFSFSHEEDDSTEQDRGLPILVYIHGGAFRSGSGDADLNGPEYLVSRRVIVITFNYRINVFGFLYLNTPEVPGNQGLRDQVTLLRWVQRNARAFGGDPGDVTIMGQSAGAACAHFLSLSEATKGLFKRVIISSGTANRGFNPISPLYSKAVAALFLTELGINTTDTSGIHEQLMNMPLDRILLANSRVQYMTGIMSFVPVIETQFPGVTRVVDDDPTELVKRGRGNQYPLMVGFNTAECAYFRPVLEYFDYKRRIESNPLMLLSPSIIFQTPPTTSMRLARQAIRKYFKGRFTYDEYERSCSDTFFVYPSFQLANIRASMKGAPVYLYQFAYESQVNFVQKAAWIKHDGTGHIEDFVRVFKPNAFSHDIGVDELPAEDERMKDWMTHFVVNFVKCGNPTCKAHSSKWLPVQPGRYNYQHIEHPGVYQNSPPTPAQWDNIRFNDYVEEETRRAVSEQGALADGTPTADGFMTNFTSQVFPRPIYPFGIVYKNRDKHNMRFKHVQPMSLLNL